VHPTSINLQLAAGSRKIQFPLRIRRIVNFQKLAATNPDVPRAIFEKASKTSNPPESNLQKSATITAVAWTNRESRLPAVRPPAQRCRIW